MCKKILSFTLVVLLINVAGATPARAGAQVVGQTPNPQKMKENVRRLGAGDAARAELKLWNGRKLKGYISGTGDDDFSVADARTGVAQRVTYAQVKQIKAGNRLTAAKVGLSLAKGAAVVGAVAFGFTLLLLVSIPKT